MKSYKFGNLAVLTLSVLVLCVMISYTFGAATPPASSLSHGEQKQEVRLFKRDAELDISEDSASDVPHKKGRGKRKGGKRKNGKNRKGGNRRRGGNNKRRRDGITRNAELDKIATNYTAECECGKILSQRIIGGEPARRNTYPWQAALIGVEDELLCGGTVINNMYVLTAASCVANISDHSELTVRLREYNLNKPNQVNEINMAVSDIIIHKGYEAPATNDDIALIELDTAIDFPETRNLAPVCLPATKEELYEGEKAIASGWGYVSQDGPESNVLQDVTLKIETNDDCQAAGFPDREIKRTMICAGKKKKKGICNGDTGGPLIYEIAEGTYEQIGISSFTLAGCGEEDRVPGVFTRVNKYIRWIQRKTKDAVYCSGALFPGDHPPADHPEGPPPPPPHGPGNDTSPEPPHGPSSPEPPHDSADDSSPEPPHDAAHERSPDEPLDPLGRILWGQPR